MLRGKDLILKYNLVELELWFLEILCINSQVDSMNEDVGLSGAPLRRTFWKPQRLRHLEEKCKYKRP